MAKATTIWRDTGSGETDNSNTGSYLVTESGDDILLATGGTDRLLLGATSHSPKSPTDWNDADFDSVIYTLLTDEDGAVLTDEDGAQLYIDYTDTKETTVWRPDNGMGEVSNTNDGDYLQIDGTNFLILSTGGTDKLLLGTTVITIKAQTTWTRSDT